MRYCVPFRADFRFYAIFETVEGKRKRASFQVRISDTMMRRKKGLARLIRSVVNATKFQKKMPVHMQGDVFSSLHADTVKIIYTELTT